MKEKLFVGRIRNEIEFLNKLGYSSIGEIEGVLNRNLADSDTLAFSDIEALIEHTIQVDSAGSIASLMFGKEEVIASSRDTLKTIKDNWELVCSY